MQLLISRHVMDATDMHAIIKKLLEAVFSERSVSMMYNENQLPTRVEAGSNTSTVALRVVGGDEMGSLECETVKYGHESHVSRTREWLRCWGPAAIVNDRPALS
jgi:hypothetical protein